MGGGALPYKNYVHIETPIFSPKFSLQSISFSQITEKSAPEHHHFRVFAAPETIIFKISYLQAVSSPPACGQPERSGAIAAPETTNFTRWSPRQRPTFSRSSALAPAPETIIFTQAAPEPHIFHFAVAHTYQNVGRVPPPPRGISLFHSFNSFVCVCVCVCVCVYSSS